MKKMFLFLGCALFLFSCNMNPSKEARIQKLETEVQQTMDKMSKLESKMQALEGVNERLETMIVELEGR